MQKRVINRAAKVKTKFRRSLKHFESMSSRDQLLFNLNLRLLLSFSMLNEMNRTNLLLSTNDCCKTWAQTWCRS